MKDNLDLRGTRILVIDDSKTIRRSAETMLKKAGCEVCVAEDGFDALGKIVSFKPDLVFVDIMMPRLDGYHTCALIKSNPTLKHTPVVMLSSKDGLFDRAKGRLVGAQLYLSKPFTGEELLGAVRANLPEKAAQDTSGP
ncbi:response regulator [Thiocystis violacea]|uniref:response regulator n=1 Tax=Thiocystis violacea TaxID=13725 RepID=UPI001908532A|nr:response regulator [Thiocystis violacea]MBK1723321.1 pilus assembly protein PilG [Thiocystis violacea]